MSEGDFGDVSPEELDRMFDESFGEGRFQERMAANARSEKRLLIAACCVVLLIVLAIVYGEQIDVLNIDF